MTAELLAPAAVLALTVIAGVVLRVFLKTEHVVRIARLTPVIIEAVKGFVEDADKKHDKIMETYAERAEKEGMDARLLWVIDSIEEYAKKQLGVTVDLNWVIAQVERYISERKR